MTDTGERKAKPSILRFDRCELELLALGFCIAWEKLWAVHTAHRPGFLGAACRGFAVRRSHRQARPPDPDRAAQVAQLWPRSQGAEPKNLGVGRGMP